jgi:hypothetical protein
VNAEIGRPAPPGWRATAIRAAAIVRRRPELIGVALLGFLARGGLVLFVLPIVVLPTPIGISNVIGGTGITGSGASDGLVRLVVALLLLVVAAVAFGTVIGASADLLLGRAALLEGVAPPHDGPGSAGEPPISADRGAAGGEPRRTAGPSMDLSARTVTGRIVLVRAAALLPVAAAMAWATARLGAAGYHQLILPDDLTVPLVIRILGEALDAAIVVVIVWLLSELIGGLAVRHSVASGRGPLRGALGAVRSLVRRPLTSLATFIVGVVSVVVTAGIALATAAWLWSGVQVMVSDDAPAVLLVPAILGFVAAWGGGLLAVGVVVAWRGVFGWLDVVREQPLRTREDPGGREES